MSLQITNQADYAMRAMLFLANCGTEEQVPSHVIADKMQISQMFLSRINSLLSMAGLIKTQRGAKGGVSLSKDASEITLLDIITAVDGPIVLRRCHVDPSSCERSDVCPMRIFWDEVNQIVEEKLKSVSLLDLANFKVNK